MQVQGSVQPRPLARLPKHCALGAGLGEDVRKGHVLRNILNPFPPTSTAFLHLLSGNPLSRLLPHSHPRGPQAPPPARVGAQQFKLFLAKPHPPGDPSQGEAAPAPPGASCGKRLKPEPPGPCQAGRLAETGPFRTTRLSAAGSQSCSLVARSGGGLHTRLTAQQLLLSPPSPCPGPAIPASSAEGVPGQPRSPALSLRAGRLGGGQLPCVQGRFGGRGESQAACLAFWLLHVWFQEGY